MYASWSAATSTPRSPSGWSLGVDLVDEEFLDAGQGVESLVEADGAARLAQHEPAPGTGQRGRDAVGREMRLDGQVRATGLEDRQNGGHPVQVALGHHRDDRFAGVARVPTGLAPAGWLGR